MTKQLWLAIKLDLLRYMNYRRPLVMLVFGLALPPVFTALMVAFHLSDTTFGSLIGGMLIGIIFMVVLLYPFMLATVDDAGGAWRMRSVVPLSRRIQSDAMYVAVVCADMLIAVDACLTLWIYNLPNGGAVLHIGDASVAVSMLYPIMLAILVFLIVCDALMIPAVQRCPHSPQLVVAFLAVFIVIYAVFFAVISIPGQNMNQIVGWLSTHIFINYWTDTVAAIVISAMFLFIAMTVSRRIVAERED